MTISNSMTEVTGPESSQHSDDCRREGSGITAVLIVEELGLQEQQRIRNDSPTSLIILESDIQGTISTDRNAPSMGPRVKAREKATPITA